MPRDESRNPLRHCSDKRKHKSRGKTQVRHIVELDEYPRQSANAGDSVNPPLVVNTLFSQENDCDNCSPLELPRTDVQTVIDNRGCKPDMFSRLYVERTYITVTASSAIFSFYLAIQLTEPIIFKVIDSPQETAKEIPYSSDEGNLSLLKELFSVDQPLLPSDSSWVPIIFNAAKSLRFDRRITPNHFGLNRSSREICCVFQKLIRS